MGFIIETSSITNYNTNYKMASDGTKTADARPRHQISRPRHWIPRPRQDQDSINTVSKQLENKTINLQDLSANILKKLILLSISGNIIFNSYFH